VAKKYPRQYTPAAGSTTSLRAVDGLATPDAIRSARRSAAASRRCALLRAGRPGRVRRESARQRTWCPSTRHRASATRSARVKSAAARHGHEGADRRRPNLSFGDPIFKVRRLHLERTRACRAFALQKTMHAMAWAWSLGAKPTSSGVAVRAPESTPRQEPGQAISASRGAVNFLCEYAISNRYKLRFCPRGQTQRAAR